MVKRVFKDYPAVGERLVFAVSHTTRPPRPGEMEGQDYYFVSVDCFEAMVAAGEFLEWAMVHGQHKGTSLREVERLLVSGKDVLLDIDVQGGRSVDEKLPGAPSIFILPPSYSELEMRLRGRGLDSPEQIEQRLKNARSEIQHCKCYEYVILNEDLASASAVLASIFLSRRNRRERMQGQIDQVLSQFPS
jgi:guanylate kinase